MKLSPKTKELLSHALIETKEEACFMHPNRLRLALGCDSKLIGEVITWATNGNPSKAVREGKASQHTLDALFPAMAGKWDHIKP